MTESILSLISDPLLETQDEIIGDLRQGAEYAKEEGDGLASIWIPPVQNDRANEVSIFVAGLSGETAREFHPVSGEAVHFAKIAPSQIHGGWRPGRRLGHASDPRWPQNGSSGNPFRGFAGDPKPLT